MSAAYCWRFSAGEALNAGEDEADLEAEEAVDATHPLGVEAGQVVVDGDEVDALAAEPVEVGRQRRHEGLALARLHLGHPAEVQRRAAHQLDVEVALADDPLGGLAGDGERLDGDVVEVGAVGQALAELGGLGLQLLVGQALELGLEGVDVRHHALQRLELLALAGAEDAIEDAHAGFEPTACPGRRFGGRGVARRRCDGRPPSAGARRRQAARAIWWRRSGVAANAAGTTSVAPACSSWARRRAQRGTGRHDVVDEQHARPAARAGGPGTSARAAGRARSRPVCGPSPSARSSSRRHGTPSWRATWRATSSAWSKPRSRRRRPLVGAHVTTSTRSPGRRQPVDEQPGEVPGDRPPVAVLEPEQHVAHPTGERGGDEHAVGAAGVGPADEGEAAGPTDRGTRGVAAGAAGREDHGPSMTRGCHGEHVADDQARCRRRQVPATVAPVAVVRLPDPCLVVLVGVAGAGKSTWARRWFAAGGDRRRPTTCAPSSGATATTCGRPRTRWRSSS